MTHYIRLIASSLILLLWSSGCSTDRVDKFLRSIVKAPPSSIERDVKGHEQIYSVQLILRLAVKSQRTLENGDKTYIAYDHPNKSTPIPIVQEISLSKDDHGNMTITSDRKAFDVVKSDTFRYALEIKYYDANGMLINYQFSGYYPEDEENSTLLMHQHFFTLQSYSLSGAQLVYPMTMDSIYYSRYAFATKGDGRRIPATRVSFSNIYAPEDDDNQDPVHYRQDLAQRAIELSMKPSAVDLYHDPITGQSLRLYQTPNNFTLNDKVPEIFSYEYRDTDPIEEGLGKELGEYDDLHRLRSGNTVIRLRENRSLDDGAPYDALGFKGILQFKQSNMVFQMRICICHILNRVSIPANPNRLGKYGNTRSNINGGVYDYNALQTVWNSFDIDYPIAFRVIADLDGNQTQCVRDIQKCYPQADQTAIERMLWGDGSFFDHIPKVTI